MTPPIQDEKILPIADLGEQGGSIIFEEKPMTHEEIAKKVVKKINDDCMVDRTYLEPNEKIKIVHVIKETLDAQKAEIEGRYQELIDTKDSQYKAEIERFESDIKLMNISCCNSCQEDKAIGYGDDISECCCRHSHLFMADDYLRTKNEALQSQTQSILKENERLHAVEQDWLKHDCGVLMQENKAILKELGVVREKLEDFRKRVLAEIPDEDFCQDEETHYENLTEGVLPNLFDDMTRCLQTLERLMKNG